MALSSHYDYSESGTKAGKINLGGGLLANINISDKFSISTGIQFAKHNLKYSENTENLSKSYNSETMLMRSRRRP